MKSITFYCEVITPMFLAGADGRTPELRPPSIKGALRFWWRALNGHRSILDLKAREGEIFGNTEKQSGFYIEILSQPENLGEERLVPHKHFTATAFLPGSTFSVRLVNRTLPKNQFKNIANLFVLLSFLDGLGKRSRRGMGAFKINRVQTEGIDFSLPEDSLDGILKLIKDINPFLKYTVSEKKIKLAKLVNNEYPYLEEVSIAKTDIKDMQELVYRINKAAHYIRQEKGASYVLGNARGFRFASPVIAKPYPENLIFITRLATFPPPKFRKYVNIQIQDKFIESFFLFIPQRRLIEKPEKEITIKEEKKDLVEVLNFIEFKNLKIKLNSLKIRNFKGITDAEYKDIQDITIFIGDNGYGKTTILEALAILLDNVAVELFGKEKELQEDNLKKFITHGKLDGYLEGNFSLICDLELNEEAEDVLKEYNFYNTEEKNALLESEIKVFQKLGESKKSEKLNTTKEVKFEKVYIKFGDTPLEIENQEKTKKILKEYFDSMQVKYPFMFFGNKIDKEKLFKENPGEKETYTYYKALSSNRYNVRDIENWLKNNLSFPKEVIKAYFKILSSTLTNILNTEDERVRYAVGLRINNNFYFYEQLSLITHIIEDEKQNEILINQLKSKNEKAEIKFLNGDVLELTSISGDIEFVIIKQDRENISLLNYSELSAGEKNIFSIVADIVTRMYFATQEHDINKLHLKDQKAIILIDEVDLHLHPKWQRTILPKLIELFPSVQFVITTHSAFVFLSLNNLIKLSMLEKMNYFNFNKLEVFSLNTGTSLKDNEEKLIIVDDFDKVTDDILDEFDKLLQELENMNK